MNLRVAALISFAACWETTVLPPAPPPSGLSSPTFHGDRARLGWNDLEKELTIAKVEAGLDLAWSSPKLDAVTLGGTTYEPHLYATPLYADDLAIAGTTASVVFAATTSGFAYAIAAFPIPRKNQSTIAAGTILWRASLGTPVRDTPLDGGVPLGVLGTPFLDLASRRLYVASIDGGTWKLFALDTASGAPIAGWPVALDAAVPTANKNGPKVGFGVPTRFLQAVVLSQRSALNLSPDGSSLYVSFGSYYDGGVGWMVAVDTRTPKITASFSGSSTSESQCPSRCDLDKPSGGMWSAGGASIDEAGRVYTTTGNSPIGQTDAPGVWGQSVVAFTPSLDLAGTYTPYDYCVTDIADADISGSAPIVLPTLGGTSTPHLIAFGSKQGMVYLVDRDALPGGKDKRPLCDPNAIDPAREKSLVPPSTKLPLNVFGPFSEGPNDNNLDHAKMRSTPAFFFEDGRPILFVSGTTKDAALANSIAPSLAKLRIETPAGAPAWLSIDRVNDVAFKNPGSPVVTSHGGADAIVWVLDENARRTDALLPSPGYAPPHPILYAFDAKTLRLLWRSTDDQLEIGGKYNHPVIAHGTVMVGTDRIQAFRAR